MEDRVKLFKDDGYEKGEDGIYRKDGDVHPFMINMVNLRSRKKERVDD